MDQSSQNSVWLGRPSTALITFKDDDSQLSAPAIGVWIPNLAEKSELLAIQGRDIEDGMAAYVIVKVEPNEANATAKVYMRALHDDFEDETATAPELTTVFSMVLPQSVLGVALALGLVEEGFYITVFDGPKPRNAEALSYRFEDVALTVIFPPVDTITHEEATDGMIASLAPSFTSPLFPRSYDDVQMTSPEAYQAQQEADLRRAQTELFDVLVALSRNDRDGVEKLRHLIDQFSEYYAYRETDGSAEISKEARDGAGYYNIFHRLVFQVAYKGTTPFVPMKEEGQPEREQLDEHDEEMEEAFNELISGDLSQLFTELADKPTLRFSYPEGAHETVWDIADPFRNGVPERMSRVQELFDNEELKDVAELVRWDWTKPEVAEAASEKYSDALITLAVIVVIAARLAPISEEMGTSTVFQIARVLTTPQEQENWELPALSPSLEHYDTAAFRELLGTAVHKDGVTTAPYLHLLLHGIGHLLEDEEWTLDNMDERLDMLEFEPPKIAQIKRFLVEGMTAMNEDETPTDDDGNVMCSANVLAGHFMENWLFADIVDITAILLPIFADLNAARLHLDLGSDGWAEARKHYLSDLLEQIGKSAGGRVL